jgi:hypothetical protein
LNRPVPEPVDVVLHIGTGKTGTTTVQDVLGRSRATLAEHGTLYPRTFGRFRHTRFGFFVQPDAELVSSPEWVRAGHGHTDPTEFRRAMRRRLRRELTPDVRRILLSDEGLYRRSAAAVDRVRRFADARGGSVRVVVYLRRQDEHVASNYQQVVKGGEVARMTSWAGTDLSPTYDYHRNLTRWRDHLSPDAFVVRPFEPDRFVGGSLLDDFLDAAGIGVPSADLAPAQRRNESLSAEAVEVLRLLNLHRVEHEGAQAGLIVNQEHIARLQQVAGPTLTLPGDDLDRFLGRWAESNRALARTFLGSEELFRAPRRTEGTTTEQVLDPGRLDHFLDLLAIPEEHHSAIRSIAEREASGVRA